MPKIRDLGDVTVTCHIAFGMRFESDHGVGSEHRHKLIEKMSELKEEDRIIQLEGELLEMLIERLGYTEEGIQAQLEARSAERTEAREAEERGRKERTQRRIRGRR